MLNNITTVGFFEHMTETDAKKIFDDTELDTIFCESQWFQPLIKMKKEGKIDSLQNIVLFGKVSADKNKQATEVGLALHDFDEVVKLGETLAEVPFRESQPDDVYMLCYSSGTSGESKGVKLTHRNIFTTSIGVSQFIPTFSDDVYISYLPMSHQFE